MKIFTYGDIEISHLKSKDKKLGEAIDIIGKINREIYPDIFEALIKSIIGQQISTKAQQTIWKRMVNDLGEVTPENILDNSESKIQSYGITYRKAGYMLDIAERVYNGKLNLAELQYMTDDEICKSLIELPGIGVWTAEMLLIFSLERPNILSCGDLAILRGMRMLYHHRKITKELFEKYRRRYSPYGSVASLYLWAIAGGQIEGMKDYASK